MLPIIIILILLLTAGGILLIRKNGIAKMLTLAALAVGFVLSIMVLTGTQDGSRIQYQLGGDSFWALVWDAGTLEAIMSTLFCGIGFLIMWASVTMIEHDVEEKRIPLYYALICILIATLCGVVYFDRLINIYIFIELSSFAAAGIVIIKNHADNIRAGLKYLTLSILGSGLVLMGMVILYTVTSSLSMTGIHESLRTTFAGNEMNVAVSMIFVTVGVCFKSALFPFHIWLPDAHGTAPSPSSAVLSSLVLKAYIVFFIKMLYQAIGYEYIQESAILGNLLRVVLFMGVIAMIVGSCLAILQTDIKRMIAYSSVAQIGYIFMGIGLGTELGLVAAVFHILAHAVTKSSLFLIAGSIIEQTGERRLDKMGQFGLKMPITMSMFTIGALSMVGIPLFVGFNSKWNFATAIMDSGSFWVAVALAVSSLLNALYYLPIVIRAFFGKKSDDVSVTGGSAIIERPIAALVPIAILSGLVIFIAVFSGPFISLIEAGVAGFW